MFRARNESGMNTAEYAVGVVAAAGFGCALCAVEPWFLDFLQSMLEHALQEARWAIRWPL
ncbi:MAG: DUF4244 domain-containing protein [Nocardioidaceae bacterium]